MTAKPQKVSLKERLAATSAKREIAISTNSDIVKDVSREAEKAPEITTAKPAPKTLPKVTLYAHEKVLKAIRLVAVEDGVQAQEILRAAVRDYLATRGHHFTDLTTGM